jgi:hypothetical protein
VTLLLLACLFPPWRYTSVWPGSSAAVSRPAGYAFVLSPPPPEHPNKMYGVEIDAARLVVQCAIVLVAGAAFSWSHLREDPRSKTFRK